MSRDSACEGECATGGGVIVGTAVGCAIGGGVANTDGSCVGVAEADGKSGVGAACVAFGDGYVVDAEYTDVIDINGQWFLIR